MTLEDLASLPLDIRMVTDEMIEALFHYDKNSHYQEYQRQKRRPRSVRAVERDDPDKVVTVYADGSREIVFETGVRKEIFESGYSIIHFKNQDVKQVGLWLRRNCPTAPCCTSSRTRTWSRSPSPAR